MLADDDIGLPKSSIEKEKIEKRESEKKADTPRKRKDPRTRFFTFTTL